MRPLVRIGAVVAALASTVVLVGPETGAAAAPAATPPRVRSVLVLSLPAISWADLRDADTPNLHRLLAGSAIADLSTRTVRTRTDPSNGYAALGAGARAVADSTVAGQNLEPDEQYGNSRAGEVFTRRTGHVDTSAVGVLGIASLIDSNKAQSYGTVPGALGTALRKAGIDREVIANADEAELEPPDQQLHREAAMGLMDQTGRVQGHVGRDLLERDPAAPFGLRLDPTRVLAAFGGFTTGRRVTLVEASDLARADAYRADATAHQRTVMRTAAIASTDALVGRLLRQVDLRRDAVLVVGPYHTSRQRQLTIAALHAPGVEPGYLDSSTTRRAGFVQIVDLAPTVLDLLHVPRPDSMEGRPVEVSSSGADFAARTSFLVRANREGVFRDNTIGTTTAILVAVTIGLAVAAGLALRYRVGAARALLGWCSFALLGFLIGTFLAGTLPFDRWGKTTYLLALLGWSLVFAAACRRIGRRHPADGLLAALGLIVTVHVVDLLSGAHLELNTVFGYTATVGIRIAGAGNPGSAQLCASALLLAVLVAWRVPPPLGRRTAVVLLALVVVVVGSPTWGQDFGGAISAAPAYLLFVLLVYGKRITARAVGLLAGVLVAAGLVVGAIDLARPAGQQTHVGRFFEKVGSDGLSGFTEVVGRKLSLMIRTFSNTGWVLMVLVALAVFVYMARTTDLLPRLLRGITTLRAGLIAFATLIVLATVLNDSGVQVTGMMTAVFVPTFVVLGCRASELAPAVPDPPAATPGDERAPARSPA